jgi:hypothetical protein
MLKATLKATLAVTLLAATMGLMAQTAATAGPPAGAATVGRVTLFANPDFTGATTLVAYPGCSPTYSAVTWQVGSYDNRPADGCRVVLRNAAGAEHPLCIGRAVVPVEFRQGPRLIVRQGISFLCPVFS